MYRKTIICFANSYKHGGYCLAGKEIQGGHIGQWIRPVSNRPGHEVSAEEMRYSSEGAVRVLDIAQVHLDGPSPVAHQPENHLLARNVRWTRVGRASWTLVDQSTDDLDVDFWGGGSSSAHGLLDRLTPEYATAIGSSLKLVNVTDLCIIVATEAGYQLESPRRKVRAEFSYGSRRYRVVVTDPHAKSKYLALKDGEHVVGPVVLCISNSEVLGGFVYRLLAAIITPATCEA